MACFLAKVIRDIVTAELINHQVGTVADALPGQGLKALVGAPACHTHTDHLYPGPARFPQELLNLAGIQGISRDIAPSEGGFGPDKLANLDGEALLTTMHAHGNKDSLVYWIEFKNDEELPARFGSIAGGSAFKFGIFRRKETGTWVTADEGNNPKDLTVEEAVTIARKHRDQLFKGVELLKQLPVNADDAAYKRLQEQLDQQAPDVSDLAWGHKYPASE